jgi:hypothetical protein
VYDYVDNARFSVELSETDRSHECVHTNKSFMRCLATLTGEDLPKFRRKVGPISLGRIISVIPEERESNFLRNNDNCFTSQQVLQPTRLEN